MDDDKKTVRRTGGARDTSRADPGQGSSRERNFFDEWVDRRLKTMHDAVLDEKIPDDMLRMLLGDTADEETKSERGTSDDANRLRPEGQPDAEVRPGRHHRH
ncbi:hypothetical protein STVA_08280 [Allostella vacuolata]|nr:hypothetical protein STVA_08280 [Stella vacuolata]